MTQLTAMQRLIEMIGNGINNKKELIKTFGDFGGDIGNGIKYLDQVKEIATELLQEEKEQILNAYWDGGQNIPLSAESCESYYTATFKIVKQENHEYSIIRHRH